MQALRAGAQCEHRGWCARVFAQFQAADCRKQEAAGAREIGDGVWGGGGGAESLRRFFKSWDGGRLVLNIAEMPIKCPVAPLEFLFLADSFFSEMGIRDKVDLHFLVVFIVVERRYHFP